MIIEKHQGHRFDIPVILLYFFRTLLINGLSFECNGDGDYDASSSIDETPRRVPIRVKAKTQSNTSSKDERVQIVSATNVRDKTPTPTKTRDSNKTKRIRRPPKSRSSVVKSTSMSVSVSSSVSSSDDNDNHKSTKRVSTGSRRSQRNKISDRGIFVKWPSKVIDTR